MSIQMCPSLCVVALYAEKRNGCRVVVGFGCGHCRLLLRSASLGAKKRRGVQCTLFISFSRCFAVSPIHTANIHTPNKNKVVLRPCS